MKNKTVRKQPANIVPAANSCSPVSQKFE